MGQTQGKERMSSTRAAEMREVRECEMKLCAHVIVLARLDLLSVSVPHPHPTPPLLQNALHHHAPPHQVFSSSVGSPLTYSPQIPMEPLARDFGIESPGGVDIHGVPSGFPAQPKLVGPLPTRESAPLLHLGAADWRSREAARC